jgi:hypothetical protein
VDQPRSAGTTESRADALTLLAGLAFAAAVAIFFVWQWHSPASSLAYNVPIAVPFAIFFLERLRRPRPGPAELLIDLIVVALALLRVFAPPLPFVSGHSLFSAHCALSARRWPLRGTAFAVLVHVVYIKLFVTGGGLSLFGGIAVALIAAALRQRLRASALR